MADPVGYAHAANLTGGDDLAVTLAGQLREAQEAIARVRDVHERYDCPSTGVPFCTCDQLWPCATLRALDLPEGTS